MCVRLSAPCLRHSISCGLILADSIWLVCSAVSYFLSVPAIFSPFLPCIPPHCRLPTVPSFLNFSGYGIRPSQTLHSAFRFLFHPFPAVHLAYYGLTAHMDIPLLCIFAGVFLFIKRVRVTVMLPTGVRMFSGCGLLHVSKPPFQAVFQKNVTFF